MGMNMNCTIEIEPSFHFFSLLPTFPSPVVVGQMTEARPDASKERSEITVAAKQAIHQREPHFFQRVKRSDPHLTGTVTVSSKCGLRPGTADMLMTGRLRLTVLSFTCVTYLHEWRRIQQLVECER